MQINAVQISAKLELVEQLINEMIDANWRQNGSGQELQQKLADIWKATYELQKGFANPAILDGYKADAVHQVLRIGELIDEMGLEPDHRQLLSIGMAAELAIEKIKDYLAMRRYAAKAQALAKEAA